MCFLLYKKQNVCIKQHALYRQLCKGFPATVERVVYRAEHRFYGVRNLCGAVDCTPVAQRAATGPSGATGVRPCRTRACSTVTARWRTPWRALIAKQQVSLQSRTPQKRPQDPALWRTARFLCTRRVAVTCGCWHFSQLMLCTVCADLPLRKRKHCAKR